MAFLLLIIIFPISLNFKFRGSSGYFSRTVLPSISLSYIFGFLSTAFISCEPISSEYDLIYCSSLGMPLIFPIIPPIFTLRLNRPFAILFAAYTERYSPLVTM